MLSATGKVSGKRVLQGGMRLKILGVPHKTRLSNNKFKFLGHTSELKLIPFLSQIPDCPILHLMFIRHVATLSLAKYPKLLLKG